MVMHITIEGNVGVGKSTILETLRQRYKEKAVFVTEPVVAWEERGFLNGMYSGEIPHPEFQHMAMISIGAKTVEGLQKAAATDGFVVQERSIDSGFEVFAKVNCDTKSCEVLRYSYECTQNVVELWKANNGTNETNRTNEVRRVYLRISPELSYERMLKRCRHSELHVSYDYLCRIHDAYDNWLLGNPDAIVVDASEAIDIVSNKVVDVVQSLTSELSTPSQS